MTDVTKSQVEVLGNLAEAPSRLDKVFKAALEYARDINYSSPDEPAEIKGRHLKNADKIINQSIFGIKLKDKDAGKALVEFARHNGLDLTNFLAEITLAQKPAPAVKKEEVKGKIPSTEIRPPVNRKDEFHKPEIGALSPPLSSIMAAGHNKASQLA